MSKNDSYKLTKHESQQKSVYQKHRRAGSHDGRRERGERRVALAKQGVVKSAAQGG
nr:hypothetical protein [Parapedobacter luteus]